MIFAITVDLISTSKTLEIPNMRKLSLKFIFVSFVLLVLLSSYSYKDRDFQIVRSLEIFANSMKEINQHYVEDVAPMRLLKTATKAMLKTLDPYTVYISEDDIEDYRTKSTGEYAGIGATTRTIDGKHKVLMVYEGYPAFKAGLKIGDIIESVDDISIGDKSEDEITQIIRGQVGTEIRLKVSRPYTNEQLVMTITRKKIKIESIPYSTILDDDIGFLTVKSFTPNVGKETQEEIEKLIDQGAEKIILDLRGNPGGLLAEAVSMCNIFLGPKMKVVSTKGKLVKNTKIYSTQWQPLDTKIPLVIMVDERSASASEIVSGVIQDYDRGVIVGKKTFGKGLVQLERELTYNARMRVTTSRYYIPSGRCIQKINYTGDQQEDTTTVYTTAGGREVYGGGGVRPDSVVEWDNESTYAQYLYIKGFLLDYATQYRHQNDSIPSADEFRLSNQDWEDFKNWSESKVNYPLRIDSLVEDFLQTPVGSENKNLISNILEKARSNEQDLNELNKNQIVYMLQKEIVSQYYYSEGAWQHQIRQDDQLTTARAILHDLDLYKKILGR